MYVHMYTCIHVHICIRMCLLHICICIFGAPSRTNFFFSVTNCAEDVTQHMCAPLNLIVYMYIYIYTYTYMFIPTCIHICIYIYICIYICVSGAPSGANSFFPGTCFAEV